MKNFFVLIFILISFNLLAEDKKDNVAKKREFTQEEFNSAVMVEVEKKMTKVGRGKLVGFSKDLLKKEQDIVKKEQELKRIKEEIENNKKELLEQIAQFKKSQQKFLACRDEIDGRESKRITHMVDVISGMKPQSASDILSVQDAKISVQILAKLDPAKVSKIFNLMDKEISARLQKQYMTMKE